MARLSAGNLQLAEAKAALTLQCQSVNADWHFSYSLLATLFRPLAAHVHSPAFGGALAEWLAEHLKARGVAIEGIIAEDFGWVVMVSRKPFMLWLGCGNTDGSTTEWTVFLVAELSLTQRLFRRIDPMPEVEKLKSHLIELVPVIPDVSKVVWE